ncbi:hypothetical protein V6N13_142179 [Hibiscus sabdariffa]
MLQERQRLPGIPLPVQPRGNAHIASKSIHSDQNQMDAHQKHMHILEATPENFAMPEAAVGPSASLHAEKPAPIDHQPSPAATSDQETAAPEEPTEPA